MKEYTNIKLSNQNQLYINDLIAVLKSEYSKSEISLGVKVLLEKYKNESINGLLGLIITDITCHLGIYESETNSFNCKNEPVSFKEGIQIYLESLTELRDKTSGEIHENIYQIFEKWICYEEQQIEVEILESEPWNYNLVKDVFSEDYYFSMIFNTSAAYWHDIVPIPKTLKTKLLQALRKKNKVMIDEIAHHLRTQYYREKKQ